MFAKPLFTFAVVAIVALPPGADARALQAPSESRAEATPATETRAARVTRLESERLAAKAELAALRAQAQGQAPAGAQPLEARIAELERRVQELEAELAKLRADAVRSLPGTQSPADPAGLQPADVFGQGGQVTAGNAFNPSIPVIPDGVYYNDNRSGAAAGIASGAAGFDTHGAGNAGHGQSVERGFNLRELEVSFSGSVDPYFDAWAVLAVGGGEIEAEEAFVQTRKFIPGLQVKFGKFFSGVGYLNRQHPHQWDFVDQALPYELLFGAPSTRSGCR